MTSDKVPATERFNAGIGSGERDRLLARVATLEAAPFVALAGLAATEEHRARILAIDPGPTQSAFVLLSHGKPVLFDKVPNEELLGWLKINRDSNRQVIIEWITVASVAGAEVYQTCRWVGRFEEAAGGAELLPRTEIKRHLFGKVNVKSADALVRRAMLDRFGGDGAKGTKAAPGPLYQLKADCWSALAVAVVWSELHPAGGPEQ